MERLGLSASAALFYESTIFKKHFSAYDPCEQRVGSRTHKLIRGMAAEASRPFGYSS